MHDFASFFASVSTLAIQVIFFILRQMDYLLPEIGVYNGNVPGTSDFAGSEFTRSAYIYYYSISEFYPLGKLLCLEVFKIFILGFKEVKHHVIRLISPKVNQTIFLSGENSPNRRITAFK